MGGTEKASKVFLGIGSGETEREKKVYSSLPGFLAGDDLWVNREYLLELVAGKYKGWWEVRKGRSVGSTGDEGGREGCPKCSVADLGMRFPTFCFWCKEKLLEAAYC